MFSNKLKRLSKAQERLEALCKNKKSLKNSAKLLFINAQTNLAKRRSKQNTKIAAILDDTLQTAIFSVKNILRML